MCAYLDGGWRMVVAVSCLVVSDSVLDVGW